MLPLFAALLTVAQAQDTVRLTFPQALEHARRNNPDFITERLDYDNAIIDLASAKADRYYPEVALSFVVPQYVSRVERDTDEGRVTFDRTERRTLETELEFEQPLPTGGVFRLTGTVTGVGQPLLDTAYSAVTFLGFQLEQQVFGINQSVRRYRLAQEQFARNSAQFADEERNLAREVMEAYYNLVEALKQAQIDSVLFVRDSIRNAGRTNEPRQVGTGVDSLKFELEVLRSALNRTQSDDEVNEARTELNELLALPAEAVVIPDTTVLVLRITPNVEAGLASARANRQDLRLAELGVENREAGLQDARRTSPVTLFVHSRVGFDGFAEALGPRRALGDALASQDRSRTLDLGVRVPLFDRFEERHAVAQAHNDLRSSQINLADQQRRIENEVRDAARSVNNANRRLDLAERQAVLTQQTLAIQMNRYNAGEIPLVEFLLDQTAAREAEVELIEAQVDVLTAVEEWRRAIGERSGLVGPGAGGAGGSPDR